MSTKTDDTTQHESWAAQAQDFVDSARKNRKIEFEDFHLELVMAKRVIALSRQLTIWEEADSLTKTLKKELERQLWGKKTASVPKGMLHAGEEES